VLVGLAVLAGCGDSGPHLPKAEYVRRGDAICARYKATISKLGQPRKLDEVGPYIANALPPLERTVRDLGKLAPPSDLESGFGKFMDAVRATLTRAKAIRTAAAKADGLEVERLLKEASRASKDRAALAKAAGLKTCALS